MTELPALPKATLWKDATRHHDVNWDAVHAVIGNMSEHERGWYRGLFDGWAYAQAQVLNGKLRELAVDAPEGYTYSPVGNLKLAAHFYEEAPPPPPEAVKVDFDPLRFLCVAADCDAEAAIVYVRFSKYESPTWMRSIDRSLRVHIASTESHYGLPARWPKIAPGSDEDVWRPFRHAVKLNAWLAGA